MQVKDIVKDLPIVMEEFYKNDRIVLTKESTKSIDTIFRQRVSFDLRKKGEDLLTEFKTKQN